MLPDVTLEVVRLTPHALLPQGAYKASVGFDLAAHLISSEGRPLTATIAPRSTKQIRTGLAVKPADGYFAAICSRSGLGMKSIFITNSPGIIDPDFRGEIQLLVYNGGSEPYYVKHGDRLAQLVLLPAVRPAPLEVQLLDKTERGEKGFGSTGL